MNLRIVGIPGEVPRVLDLDGPDPMSPDERVLSPDGEPLGRDDGQATAERWPCGHIDGGRDGTDLRRERLEVGRLALGGRDADPAAAIGQPRLRGVARCCAQVARRLRRGVTVPHKVAFPRIYPDSRVVEVVDGDSVRVELDLGFDLHWRVLCRLHGIAAREKSDPGGPEARAHLAELIPPGAAVDVRSLKYDKFSGRVQVVLTRPADGLDVNTQMIRDGYAAPWDGRGEQPKPPWPLPG